MLRVTAEGLETPDKLEAMVDADIRDFEEWFKAQGNDPLVRSEIAIMKTYCFFKMRVQQEKEDVASQASGSG